MPRASDFGKSVVSNPNNDLMMEVNRYAYNAQTMLRKSEWDAVAEAAHHAGELLPQGINPRVDNKWPLEAEKISDDIRWRLRGHKELADGFKRFVENAKAASSHA